MLKFKFGPVPPQKEGGFHFPQKLRTGDIEYINASTKDELDKKILQFRSENGLDIGDPMSESDAYLCGKWPDFCEETGIQVADESPQASLRKRTTNWRYNRYSESQSDSSLVLQEVAESRAKICAGCPKNQPNTEGCAPCVKENNRVLFMLRGGNSVKTDPPLGGCEVCGQDNQTAAFFPESRLKYANRWQDEFPDFCWLKKHG